jgi:hypothetical protein
MTKDFNLEVIDVDGAVREAAAHASEALNGDTRRRFLRKAGLAGGALAGGGAVLGVLAPSALACDTDGGRPPSSFGQGDIGILNYALTLEYLEAAFYNEATANGAITDPQTLAFLVTVTRDENAHVAYLQQALGSAAVPSPQFDFQGIPEDQSKFQQTAFVLENTGVHAYLGQALNIQASAILAAAASIVTIEARHASVIGSIINDTPAGIAPDGSFDTPYTAEQVLSAVGATGFITGGLPSGGGWSQGSSWSQGGGWSNS